MLHDKPSAHALALVRIAVYGIWLVTLIVLPYERYSQIPFEWFAPYGPARFVPRAFWQFLLQPPVLLGMRIVLGVLATLLVLGVRPFRPLALTFALLLSLLDTMTLALNGAVVHSAIPALYAAWALAFFPADDALSVMGRRWSSPSLYRAPLLLLSIAMATGYMLISGRRLVEGGLDIFTGDAILTYMGVQSLNHSSWNYEFGLLPLTMAPLAFGAKAGFFVTTLVEVTSPLALFSTWYRRLWLASMLPFHVTVLLTMNIFFWQNMVLIVFLFTALPYWLGARLSRFEIRNPAAMRSASLAGS